jgi:hypothetical protein
MRSVTNRRAGRATPGCTTIPIVPAIAAILRLIAPLLDPGQLMLLLSPDGDTRQSHHSRHRLKSPAPSSRIISFEETRY